MRTRCSSAASPLHELIAEGFQTLHSRLTPALPMLVILLGGSALLRWGERAVARGHDATGRLAIIQTIGLGLAFLIIQISTFRHATMFVIIGAHGANVLLALLMLSWLLFVPRIGAGGGTARHPMRSAARYWHCVGAGWIAIVVLLMFGR